MLRKPRWVSPRNGCSILMTSAPQSARIPPAAGTNVNCATSSTRTPAMTLLMYAPDPGAESPLLPMPVLPAIWPGNGAGSMPAGQRRDGILEPRRIAQCQDIAVAPRMQRFAIPVADGTPGALDHRHQRGPVVQLEVGLADQIDMAGGKQRIIVAVSAHYHPPMVG